MGLLSDGMFHAIREAAVGKAREALERDRRARAGSYSLLREGSERDARLVVERCWRLESTRSRGSEALLYWSQFLALRARLVPQSPAMRGRRLSDDPGALEEWASVARGEAIAEGFTRNTAYWCTAPLAPYQPSLLASIPDDHQSARALIQRLRRAAAAMLGTPGWFATMPEDLAASQSPSWAAIREHDDGSDGIFIRCRATRGGYVERRLRESSGAQPGAITSSRRSDDCRLAG
jgi:hypothetical protein